MVTASRSHGRARGITRCCLLAVGIFILTPLSARAQASSAASIYKATSPAVVLIYAVEQDGKPGRLGAGVIISQAGHILTSYSLVFKGGMAARSLQVFRKPDELQGDPKADLREINYATAVDVRPEWDLALIRIAADAKAPTPFVALSDRPGSPGDEIVVIGHPEQGGMWSLTTGSVSTRMPDYRKTAGRNIYRVQAPLTKFHGGSPVMDASGRLLGMVSFLEKDDAPMRTADSMNIAVGSDTIAAFLSKIPEAANLTKGLRFLSKSTSVFDKPFAALPVDLPPIPTASKSAVTVLPDGTIIPSQDGGVAPTSVGYAPPIPPGPTRIKKDFRTSKRTWSMQQMESLALPARQAPAQ